MCTCTCINRSTSVTVHVEYGVSYKPALYRYRDMWEKTIRITQQVLFSQQSIHRLLYRLFQIGAWGACSMRFVTRSILDLISLIFFLPPPSLSVSLFPPSPYLQPFPHHEFTSEECQKSLHALGLYPSASLVVSKQSVGGASAAMETGPSQSTGSTTSPVPRGSKKVSFGREQIMAASSHTNRTPQGETFVLHVTVSLVSPPSDVVC